MDPDDFQLAAAVNDMQKSSIDKYHMLPVRKPFPGAFNLFLQGRTPPVSHLRSSGSSRGVAVAVYRDLRMHWVLRFKRLLFFARHLDGGECPMELRRQQSVYQIRVVVCSPSASQRLVCCRRIMRNQKLTNGGGTIGVRGVDESQE